MGTRLRAWWQRRQVFIFLFSVILLAANVLAASASRVRAANDRRAAETPRTGGPACEEILRLAVWSRGNHGLSESADFRSADFAAKALEGFVEKLDPYRLLFTHAEAENFRRRGIVLWNSLLDAAACDYFDGWVAGHFPAAKERFQRRLRALPATAFQIRHAKGDAEGNEPRLKKPRTFARDEKELTKRLSAVVETVLSAASPLVLGAYGGDGYRYAADSLGTLVFEAAPAPRALLAKAMLGALDPFSTYFSPTEFDDFYGDLSGGASGLGLRVRRVPRGLLVEKILADAPASRSRLREGDIIVRVDGINVTTLPSMASKRLLSGPEASRARLVVERSTGVSFEENLVRRRFAFEEARVRGRKVFAPGYRGERIGVVEVPSFYGRGGMLAGDGERSSADDLRRVLADLLKTEKGLKPISGLVLDMRGNPGGYLEEAVSMAGLFLGNAEVVGVVESSDRRVLRSERSEPVYRGPLVVLVDKESASAAEIVAGALKDHRRAVLVGASHTYGKGTVQKLFHLDELAMRYAPGNRTMGQGVVKLTTSVFYSPLGHSPANGGVPTHIAIPMSDAGQDCEEEGHGGSVPRSAPFVEPSRAAELQAAGSRLDIQIAELKRLADARRKAVPVVKDEPELAEAVAIAVDLAKLSRGDRRTRNL